MARYHQLGLLLKQFANLGIPVITLKGAYLAKAVYADPALRPMADLDLLFRHEDVPKVCQLLEQNGYRMDGADEPLDWLIARRHQLPGHIHEGAEKIEVHLHIVEPGAVVAVDSAGLWERARTWSVNGRSALTLSPEDLLLHLALHAVYQHRCRIGLNAFLDIALLIARETIDWETLVARAKEWNASPYCAIALRLGQRLMGASIPETVIRSARSGQPIRSMARARGIRGPRGSRTPCARPAGPHV